ncbi:MAG: PQQ-dependent sugar dehydrogenase, partial [Rhizobacter sp.]|nr:PQQ-dependent sugar dehydrogenase [Rhizobacter sp.]
APAPNNPPPPPPPSSGPARATVLNSTLSSPWGLAFLPDGRMLITQKGGSMVVLSADGATKSNPLAGVPTVVSSGQGGLLDVVIDPDFTTPGSNWVYFAYSEAGTGGSGTAVTRGRLDLANGQLLDVPPTPLFRQLPKVGGDGHFGSRLAFRADKTLFITLGERQQGSPAQSLTSHLGKVVRINRDGSIPSDNPNMGAGASPGIWSYGIRNPQGAAIHPTTGELWELEHGPQGGDELNIARSGQNYGWPNVSYGCNYGATNAGCEIGGGVHAPQYPEPVSRWPAPGTPTPYSSIAPSGLAFYTGSGFPEWQGNVFLGALAGTALWRVVLNGNAEVSRERLFGSLGQRIRAVNQGPDGWLYFITDSGRLYRVDR